MVSRGLTVIETTVALAILATVAAVVTAGGGAELRQVGRSFDELWASRAAASRLEELRAGAELPDGPFVPGREGYEGVQRSRVVAPGLVEVEVVVAGPRERKVRLTTRIARAPK